MGIGRNLSRFWRMALIRPGPSPHRRHDLDILRRRFLNLRNLAGWLGIVALSAALAAAPSACSGAATKEAAWIEHPTGADEVVLRFLYGSSESRVAPYPYLSTRPFFYGSYGSRHAVYPDLSVYGDGSAIVAWQGPWDRSDTALPNVQSVRLSEAGMQTLLRTAQDAGLLEAGLDYGEGNYGLGGTFVVTADGRTVETRIRGGLAPGDQVDSELTPAQKELRGDLFALLDVLYGMFSSEPGELGAELGPAEPYDWTALWVLVEPLISVHESDRPEIPEWPLGDLSTIGEPHELGRTVIVSGADLDDLLPLLRGGDRLTIWHSGDAYYQLTFRPLLPDEVQ